MRKQDGWVPRRCNSPNDNARAAADRRNCEGDDAREQRYETEGQLSVLMLQPRLLKQFFNHNDPIMKTMAELFRRPICR
jgi:hypothetical protein